MDATLKTMLYYEIIPILECMSRAFDLEPVVAVAIGALVILTVGWAAMLSFHMGPMGPGMMGSGMMGGQGGDTSAAPVATSSVEMRSNLFEPAVISVSANSTVTWINADPYGHTVTSDAAGGPLDSPLIGAGGSWTYSFVSPGTYTYHCTPHASRDASGAYQGMVGLVVVT